MTVPEVQNKFKAPPLSPILLAGLPLGPVPKNLFNPLARTVLKLVQRRHGSVFERLQVLGNKCICIEPVDLPMGFLLEFGSGSPQVTVIDKGRKKNQSVAVVKGSFLNLLDLLQGKADGDALFFSRDLLIEGDTEAILTLRNALDSADIDLRSDFLDALGPFSGPGRKALDLATAVFLRASEDIETVSRSIRKQVEDRQQSQQTSIEKIKDTVADLEKNTKLSKKKTVKKKYAGSYDPIPGWGQEKKEQ